MKYIFFRAPTSRSALEPVGLGGKAFSFTARPRSACSGIGGISIADVVHLCFVTTSQRAMADTFEQCWAVKICTKQGQGKQEKGHPCAKRHRR
jgi:hypothetical protein